MTPKIILIIVAIGFTATYLWRFLGVLLADRLRPDMPVVYWVELVGYGLIATLMSRMIFLPNGPLEGTPLWLRVSAIVFSIALARFTRLSVLPAIVSGAIFFSSGLYLFG